MKNNDFHGLPLALIFEEIIKIEPERDENDNERDNRAGAGQTDKESKD